MSVLETAINQIQSIQPYRLFGYVTSVVGLVIEVKGIEQLLSVGDPCTIYTKYGKKLAAEVIAVKEKRIFVMSFHPVEGVGAGCMVEVNQAAPVIYPSEKWLGRVVNALAEPLDELGPLPQGKFASPIYAQPPNPHNRRRVLNKMDLGVKALNCFLPCSYGQRMGIFAGSGVGKSVLLSMLAKHCEADVIVIGLIGERGREVKEFIEDYLGPEGMRKTVMVVATSDETALMRRQAAYLTMTIAEYFRDQGQEVLCLMDSVTRFAMAQREIGLSVGEPPTTKGYTPSVFSELPKLLERSGPGINGMGNISGLFTVLVDGDDHNEPIADAVRSILDGHIVLDRHIAERGRFPAIDILKSISRTLPHCHTPEQNELIKIARHSMSTYHDMQELIRIGAYNKGVDAEIDQAIDLHPKLEEFLSQDISEKYTIDESFYKLIQALGGGEAQQQDHGQAQEEVEPHDAEFTDAEIE